MGVKFAREYDDIIQDLTMALREVEQFYEAFDMDRITWDGLEEEERGECVRTLADDLFYGLGMETTLQVGRGTIHYDGRKHIIAVNDGGKCINIIYLT